MKSSSYGGRYRDFASFSDLVRPDFARYSSADGRPSDRPVEIVERSAFCLACPGRRPESSNVAQSPAPDIVKLPVPDSLPFSAQFPSQWLEVPPLKPGGGSSHG